MNTRFGIFFVSLILCGLFINCTTPGKNGISSSDVNQIGDVLKFVNKTAFVVHIVRGSGRTDVGTLEPFGLLTVPNDFGETESYYPVFDVPLTKDFALTDLRSKDKDLYYQSDNTVRHQEIIITAPPAFNNNNAYMCFTNNSKTGGINLERNSTRMSCINVPNGKTNVNVNETVVYQLNPTEEYNIKVSPNNINFCSVRFTPGHIYSFLFDGKTVSLTDARPLTCIGEPTWSRKLDGTGLPVFAEYADRSIKVAIPSANGVDFTVMDAKGEETNKKTVKEYGANAVLSTMLAIDEDSYLVTGYGTRPARQFLVKQTTDDEISWTMPFPQRTGYLLNALIPKVEKTYLVLGTVDGAAYMREIEDRGRSVVSLWELWAGDVNENWKTAQTAAYNTKNSTYIIAGMYGGIDPVSGKQNAFIGFVDQSGKIDTAKTAVILNDTVVNQVLCDSSGDFYIAGQELRDGIGYAIVQKYGSDGKKRWQQTEEIKANSLYRYAILDEENGQIVLGGTMDAADKYGNKGTPFLQGIDSAKGNELWIEDISPVSKELNLVTGLQKAKGYGFIAALYGVSGKNTIFTIARLNERGKLINHESH